MQLDPGELRERLDPLFRENFEKLGELGASVPFGKMENRL